MQGFPIIRRTRRAARHAHAARRRALAAMLVLGGLVSAAACGDDEALPPGPGRVTELEILGEGISGNALTLVEGTSADVEVGGLDSDGRDNGDAVLTGSSSNTEVATVSGGESEHSRIRLAHTGFTIQGVAPGTATITFREEESGVTADLAVTVTAAP